MQCAAKELLSLGQAWREWMTGVEPVAACAPRGRRGR